MKYLLYLCFIVTVSGRMLLKHGDDSRLRDLQLSNTIDELHNRTKQLIVDTLEEMSRLKEFGVAETNSSWSAIQGNVNSTYYSSSTEAKYIVDYVIGEISSLEQQATERGSIDISNCTSIISQISISMPDFNEKQLQVALGTLTGSADSLISGKNVEWVSLIGKVNALDGALDDCGQDILCIVGVADDIVEYNLQFMEGINGIKDNMTDLQNRTETEALLVAKKTIEVFEQYVCNIGAIIESCIAARIDETPLPTTTTEVTTTPADATTVTTIEATTADATPVTTEATTPDATPVTTEATTADATSVSNEATTADATTGITEATTADATTTAATTKSPTSRSVKYCKR